MNVVFILYMGNLQFSLSKFSTNNIKANYAAEDILNRIIYDKNNFNQYFKEIIFIESRGYVTEYSDKIIKAKKDIVKKEKIDFCNFTIDKVNKTMNLNLIANCNDTKTSIEAEIDLVNHVFKRATSIIDINKLEDFERAEFEEYFNLLEGFCEDREGMFQYEPRLDIELVGNRVFKYNIYNIAEIFKEYSENHITDQMVLCDQENNSSKDLLTFKNERLLINVKNKDENKKENMNLNAQLILGKKEEEISWDSNKNDNNLFLQGVLYVEGDLIINQDVDFQGIIIVNKGNIFIEEGIKLKIIGMILYRGEEELNLDSIEYRYDEQIVYKYASYLPEYVKPKIKLIKKR